MRASNGVRAMSPIWAMCLRLASAVLYVLVLLCMVTQQSQCSRHYCVLLCTPLYLIIDCLKPRSGRWEIVGRPASWHGMDGASGTVPGTIMELYWAVVMGQHPITHDELEHDDDIPYKIPTQFIQAYRAKAMTGT